MRRDLHGRAMDDLIRVLKALADPTRVQILTLLADGDLCVGALAKRLGVTDSAVSQHLRILREAGLVDGEKRGYWVHYAVQRQRVRQAAAEVAQFFSKLSHPTPRECPPTSTCAGRGRPADKRLERSRRRTPRRQGA